MRAVLSGHGWTSLCLRSVFNEVISLVSNGTKQTDKLSAYISSPGLNYEANVSDLYAMREGSRHGISFKNLTQVSYQHIILLSCKGDNFAKFLIEPCANPTDTSSNTRKHYRT